ncbi:hypothetical protein LAN17_22805, partial [Mycobacterium tuberculosis]|nr:hypothetical protein [Mycobacterium tuberculosis]MBZ4312401.1 hypothetical protein [Mycobacterium tuberculosis]
VIPLYHSFRERIAPLRHLSCPRAGHEQKETDPGNTPQVSSNFSFDGYFTPKFIMGHRLLYWALHRSMTAWLQVVSARLCDFPDLSSD